ncbi:MAG: DUF2142 domain-containing protein [Actinomycetota bacterium]
MRQRFVLLMAVLAPLAVVWSLTNPMFASPDEPAHMARAQGFSRFDFSPPYETDGLPMSAPECFRFRAEVTADCADYTWGTDGADVETKTRDYPPLVQAVAAVPAVFAGGLTGAYFMRIWMGLVCCALLAWAGALLIRPGRGRWPVVGFALALTPMAVFVSSTVNPSGITAAFSLLVVAGVVARWVYHDRGRVMRWAVGVGLPGLVLVRRDGVLWVVILVVALLPIVLADADTRARLRGLDPRRWTARSRAIVLLGLLGTVVIAALWIVPVLHRFFTTGEVGGNGSRWQGIEVLRIYFDHMIGTFGWIDTYIGQEAFAIASGVCLLVVLTGLAGGRRDFVAAQALALLALFATPVVFGMFLYPYFQGRYMLPMWVIVAVVSALSVGSSDVGARTSGRLVVVVLTMWWVVHVWSLVQNLRRYAVGFRGSWRFVATSTWHPPMMSNLVAVASIAVAAGVSALAMRRVIAVADGR